MTVLSEWFADALAECASERDAVRVIARRLGESEPEARRLLTSIAHVRLGASSAQRRTPAAPTSESGSDGPQLDALAVQAFYRQQRESGRGASQALRATARAFGARPHDIRKLVSALEYDLQEA